MKIASAIYKDVRPFNGLFPEATFKVVERPADLDSDTDWLIIWGGGDIHPSLYGHKNVASYVGNGPSIRDKIEVQLFKRAVEKGIKIFGVCRGAQIGCAMSGGYLIQDVTGHESNHMMKTWDGRTFRTTSLHHQMMVPNGVPHELLAWADPRLSQYYVAAVDFERPECEPEVIWFPETRCLAVQGHPEYIPHTYPFNQFVKELMLAKG